MATKKPYTAQPIDTVDFDEVMRRLEAMPSAVPAVKPERSMARAVGDVGLSLGQGAVGAVKALTDLGGADNRVSQGLGDMSKFLGEQKSEQSQATMAASQARIQAAEESGSTMEEVKAYMGMLWAQPAEMLAQGVGSLATMGLGKAASALKLVGAAKAAGVSKAAFLASPAGRQAIEEAAKFGFKANIGIGAGMGVGAVKGSQYEQTEQNALKQGVSPEDAQALATEAQRYGGPGTMQQVLGGGLGALAAATGPVERLIMGRGVGQAGMGTMASMGKGFLVEGSTEGAQGAQERFAGNTAAIDSGVLDPSRRMQGVAGQFTMEGTIGGLIGGAAGPFDAQTPVNMPRQDERPSPGDTIRELELVPEGGPTTRAANKATEQKAQSADALLGKFAPDFTTELGAAPEAVPGLNMEREFDTGNMSYGGAPEYGEAMANPQWPTVPRGIDTGGLAIDGQIDQKKQDTNFQAPVQRAPRTGTTAQELDLATDPVTNYVNDLRQVNTPAAKLFVRDFDAGSLTADDVRQRMEAERTKTPDERLAAAAAEGLRMNPQGDPFKTLMAAQRAAKQTPGEVVEVQGGYAIRQPQESASEPFAPTAEQQRAEAPADELAATDAVGGQPVPQPTEDAAGSLTGATNVQDQSPGVFEAPGAVEAAPVEAPTPAGRDAAATGGVPATTGAGDVQADGVTPKMGDTEKVVSPKMGEGAEVQADGVSADVPEAAFGDMAAADLSKNPPKIDTSAEPAQETAKNEQVGQAGKTATAIRDAIAESAIKRNRKHYAEQVSKKRMTQDEADRRALVDEKTWSESKVNERMERIASAIDQKDPTVLVGAWANEGQGTYGNEGSMEAFRKLTGINLKRMNSADRARAIFDWAGWSEDQVRADVARRKTARAEADAASEAKRASEDAAIIEKQAAKMPIRIKGKEGETTAKAYIDDLIEQGYTEIGQSQSGAVKKTILYNPATNSGPTVAKGVLADYAKVAADRFKARKSTPKEGGEPFEHAGLKIKTQRVKVGDEVKTRWVVQSPENAERERKGERQIGGDRIVDTREQAVKMAEQEVQRAKDERAQKDAFDREDAERKAATEARKEANRGKAVVERRKEAILDGQTKLPPSLGLGTGSKREAMQKAVEQERAIVEVQVDDSAAKKRDQAAIDAVRRAGYILGLSNENLPVVKVGLEAQARLKANNYKKPEYRVYMGGNTTSDSYREITKTEYDYAQELIAGRAGAPQPETPSSQPSATEPAIAAGEQASVEAVNSEVGSFGPILTQYRGDAQGAIKALTELQDGEAVAALNHPEVGDIDLVWGKEGTSSSDGMGLAKLAKWHPEMLADLQGFLNGLRKDDAASGKNRIRLVGADGRAVVRLQWNGSAKTWLLTAFEDAPKDSTRTDTEVNDVGGDTASPNPERNDSLPSSTPAAQAANAEPEAEPDTPKLTQAEATELMTWQDMGTTDGVKRHILAFYRSKADADAKTGRMTVATVTKGDRSTTAWMVDGDDKTFGPLSLAKRRAMEVGMAKAVADGFVESGEAAQAPQERTTEPADTTPAKIDDSGEKIGGARKDRWKERGLNLDDLDGMTEAEGAELATKANVWKPDYTALADAAEPVTAAMVKVIYDRLAAKPAKNTPEGRRQYVQMMRIVRDVYASAQGPEAVRNAYLEIRRRAGLSTMDPQAKASGRALLFSVYKGRTDPFTMDYTDLSKAKKMVEDGFPAKGEPWKTRLVVGRREGGAGTTARGIAMYTELSAEVGTPLTAEQIEAGFFRVMDKKNKTVAFAASKEDAEAAAKTVYERDMKGGKDGKPEPERPHLDEMKRENLPKRIDRDATSEDFIKDLGFRGIEFGNWSAQDERQRILNMAYDGLMDLAEIMGVPPKAMSLNGTLGMAFGARGGGRFAAHYEPGKLVINMTKIRGGGSMAHEWAHAMDHYFGELNKADAYTTSARGASGWMVEDQYKGLPRSRMEQIDGKWKSVNKMRLDNLRPELAAAFDGVMQALFQKQINKAEMVRSQELGLERTEAMARMEPDAEMKAMYQRMAKNEREALEELRKDPEDTMYDSRGRSDFAKEAQALSGKSANGYWTRPTEMFARSFESWVFDRVTAMGARSDYLVHGVEADRFAGGGYKGNPYPTGAERARINAAFDKLADAIQTKEDDAGNVAMFSRSPMKSVEANVRRGRQALAKALDEKTTVHRAMFRNGLGWVDFVWGAEGVVKASGKTKGAMGLAHIIEARQRKDGLTQAQATALLEDVVDAIASGSEFSRAEIEDSTRVGVERGDTIVWLTKQKGSNAWIVTAYEKNPDGANAGRATSAPTSLAASLTRDQRVAGSDGIVRPAGSDVNMSRGAGSGLTQKAVQGVVDAIRARWSNAPEIVVVADMQDAAIPERVRDADAEQRSQGASGEPEGFFYKGKVYIVASALSKPADVVRVLFHETLGHAGLRGVFGESLKPILKQLAALRRADVAAKAKEYGLDMSKEADRMQAAEEVLAVLAQTRPELGYVQRAIAAIRAFLRKNVPGFAGMKMTDAEIINSFILPARRFVEGGGGGPRGGLPAFSRPDDAALSALRQADDLFAMPKSGKKTIAEITQEHDPEIKVKEVKIPGNETFFNLTMADGTTARITVRKSGPNSVYDASVDADNNSSFEAGRPGENPEDVDPYAEDVWIDVSQLKPGQNGIRVYSIASTFAHNTGRIFIGDPNGLSDEAMRRRSENMLSSALKFGTTKHLAPHPRQAKGGVGVPALKWVYGDDVGNIERLIDLNLRALDNADPDAKQLAYDPETGTFSDAATGRPVTRAQLAAAATDPRGRSGASAVSQAGWRTVARGAVFRALLGRGRAQGDGAGRAGSGGRVLDGLVRQREKLASTSENQRVFYSRSQDAGDSLSTGDGPRFSLTGGVQQTLMDAVPQGVIERLSDMTTSQRGFNRWWHRTVGTQLHKAKTNKQFAPVYYAVQDFMKDVSRMATLAADQAPDLLPMVDSLSDVKKLLPQMGIAGNRQRKAELKEASEALFDGTLRYTRDESGQAVLAKDDDAKGLIWTTAELKARGMSDASIKMYRQARKAINQSLDSLLAADVYRMITAAKPESLAETKPDYDALMGRVRKAAASANPGEAVAEVKKALTAQRNSAKARIDSLKTGANGRLDAAVASEMKRQSEEFNGIETLIERVQDKVDRIADLKASGYAPLMRFGQYTVDALDASGNRVFFGMYESQMDANQAARKFKADGLTVRQGIQSQKEFELLKGVSPETAMLFAEMMGMEKNDAMQAWLQNAVAEQSALKRHIRRKGVEGFESDASRVVAAFLTSNSRAASRALHGMRIQERVENVRDGDVKDEAIALAEYVNNPKEEAQALRSLLFINYIGGSVASALVNLTQTVVQTFPFLSQYGGPLKAGKRLGSAMKMAMGKIDDADLAAAVKRAEDDGVIKPQEVFQLQAEASRTMGSDLRVRAGLAVWGGFFQMAEVFNRRVAFVAAYQTAKEQGIKDPFAFAENAVDETQGVFNKGNRPDWARGAIGATLFTFKSFTIQYVEFIKRLPPKEKALALGVLILLSGIRGLPFAEDAEDLIDTVAQQLGYNFTTKEQMDRFLVATLGNGFADFLQHGSSTIPGVPFDVSVRLGMADLLPGTGLLKPSETRKEDQVLDVFGVAGGFVRDALKGEFRPIAFRNLVKGLDMYDREIYTDTRGRKIMEVDGVDAVMKGIGLQPNKVAAESRAVRTQYEKRALFNKVKGDISEQLALGMFESNDSKVKAARQKLDDWNEKNPEARIVINSQAIRRRVVEMRRDRADRFVRSAPKELKAATREAVE